MRFTRIGFESIHQGVSVLRQMESELAAVLGKTKMRQLHEALLLVVEELSRPERPRTSRRTTATAR